MIKGVNNVPKKGTGNRGCGARMQEVMQFVDSGKPFGQYVLQTDEIVENVYHSFRSAIKQLGLDDALAVCMRQKKLFFVRRDI